VIRTPTLFVLGAGASRPYGLPLGTELRTLICDAQNEYNPAAITIAQDGYFTHADIRDVARQFFRSNVRSIDEFLSRQPHLEGIGKALIAAILCSKENPEEILSEQNSDHWYRALWNRLVDDTTQGQDLSRNNVRFITFNYDRSLECFLHEATKGSYGLNDAAAYKIWSHFQVMHVYGSVGEFKFPDIENRARPYSTKIRPCDLAAAAGGINIIPEGRDDDEVFVTARKWFDWAQHVYILGFGFDRLNCARLNYSSVMKVNREIGKPLPAIVASVFKLTPAEVTRAQRNLLKDEGTWITHDATNAMTLRLAGLPD